MNFPGFFYHYADQMRRQLGYAWDAAGLAPVETPFRVAFTTRGVRLRAYTPTRDDGPVLLIVPAPIKRVYLWDLSPDVSVVRRCLEAGIRVYLLEWEQPDAAMQTFGLADYADRLIQECLAVVQAETGQARVFLSGHSLGGVCAALFTALHPALVQGLVLLGTPLHFDETADAISALVSKSPRAAEITAPLGNVPGTFLNRGSVLASPTTFAWLRWLDWFHSLPDEQARQTFLRVQRWSLDEMPLPQRLFEEVVEWLYRENRFIRGDLVIGGRPAVPAAVESPLVSVIYADCDIVPPAAVLPFHQAVQSKVTEVLWYPGDTGVMIQHLGMLVGRHAHQEIWPELLRWMHTHQ